MAVPNFMTIHPIVVEAFHKKRRNVNLMLALEEKSGDDQSHYCSLNPLGTMHVYHGNPSNRHRYFSLDQMVDWMVLLAWLKINQ